MTVPNKRGVSLKERAAELYREGYKIRAIGNLLMLEEGQVRAFLIIEGFDNPADQYPYWSPKPKPVRSSRPARLPLYLCPPAGYFQHTPAPRFWCEQCQALVAEARAAACNSPWCGMAAENRNERIAAR